MAWTYPAYRWPDEAAGRAAIASQGWGAGTPPGVDLLVIGTWYQPQDPVPEGEESPAPVAVPGWWLGCAFWDRPPPADWIAARAKMPDGMPRLGEEPVVLSVLPVALRRALRNTLSPVGGGDALAYVLATLTAPSLADTRDAFEYMVRAERADMIALGGPLGFPIEAVDAVLELAATYPGSDAVWGPSS